LPIELSPAEVDELFRRLHERDGYKLAVDLEHQTVFDDLGFSARFELDPFAKKCLREGLDEIALTLMYESDIAAYETAHPPPFSGA
jgi:3-isopropylmalate/(R)-2-methylmalate dehydratase small subunit